MDLQELNEARQAVIERHGPWVSHNVALPFGSFTIDATARGDNYRTFKFLQIVHDVLRRPAYGLRVLDLGSGEGLYALEFAQQGATVVAVEGRPDNLARAEFARRALDLRALEFILDDVRNVSKERYGTFDVVLCSGLIYHLQADPALDLLECMRDMCDGVCIIDTRIALQAEITVERLGRSYGGSTYQEHRVGASKAEKLSDPLSSLDNETSFWFTRHSLANALADSGFSSVMDCLIPVPLVLRPDRATFVALYSQRVHPHHQVGQSLADRRWPTDYPV